MLVNQQPRWKQLVSGLRCLEKLLSKKQMRDRFTAVCVGREGAAIGDDQHFADFSIKLGGLRWQVITEFCNAATWLSIAPRSPVPQLDPHRTIASCLCR